MTSTTLGDIAHSAKIFSDRDHLGKAFDELNAGWPVLVMVEDYPNLLLPSDAVGHRESRRLLDLPLAPALVLPADTQIHGAFDSIGEDDFIVLKSGTQFSIVARVTILESLLSDLELPRMPDARVNTSLPDIVNELPEGIVVLDAEQRISFCNRSGRRLLLLLSPARIGEPLQSLGDVPLSVLIEDAKNGLPSDVHLGKPVIRIISVRILRPLPDQAMRMVLLLRDVTHMRHRQHREATRERMAILGRLASGIAHDFNNMLTVIMGQASLIQMNSYQDKSLSEGTETILAAALKSSNLVHQLLVFGRREVVHSSALNLQNILKELEYILQQLVGDQVALELRLPEDLWPVAVDPSQIERIVANLIVNSRNAMPNGGRVVIEARNELNCASIQSGSEQCPMRAVRISIRDTGQGIKPETLSRVFEPFFTTHDEDGTGLGLATVQCEVNQLGGCVAIQSELGVGTTVEIFLPVSEKPTRTAPASAVHHASATPGGHILVIEDQEELSKVILQILEHGGYVVQVTKSMDALKMLAESGEPDLLIVDLSRKGSKIMSLSEMLIRFPTLRILVLDRETDDARIEPSAIAPLEYLDKPFSGIELLDQVALMIGEGVES